MSLFPAYIAAGEEQEEEDRGHEVVQVAGEIFDRRLNLRIETFYMCRKGML